MSESTYDDADFTRLLGEAWERALGVPVTPESDFFALGGTSLAAVEIAQAVVKRIGDHEGHELAVLEALFEAPTLADTATLLNERIGSAER